MKEIQEWFEDTGWPYQMYDGILTFVLGNGEYDIVNEGVDPLGQVRGDQPFGYAIYKAGGAHPLDYDLTVEDVIDWLEDGA